LAEVCICDVAYLKIDGIKGEATSQDHLDRINIDCFEQDKTFPMHKPDKDAYAVNL